jgi:hypothetical protein
MRVMPLRLRLLWLALRKVPCGGTMSHCATDVATT